jgi:hypothetical protein
LDLVYEDEKLATHEQVAVNPHVHHSIGKSENFSEHIGLYVMKCDGDLAVKVVARSLA